MPDCIPVRRNNAIIERVIIRAKLIESCTFGMQYLKAVERNSGCDHFVELYYNANHPEQVVLTTIVTFDLIHRQSVDEVIG